MQTQQQLPLIFRVIWLDTATSPQGRIAGPVSVSEWRHHKPPLLLFDPKVLKEMGFGDTFSPQRVYWVEGQRFLDVNKTYGDQLIRFNDVLIVTNEEDDDLIIGVASIYLANSLNKLNKKTGARDWNSLSDEIRHGH
jgi:hypothetical protein